MTDTEELIRSWIDLNTLPGSMVPYLDNEKEVEAFVRWDGYAFFRKLELKRIVDSFNNKSDVVGHAQHLVRHLTSAVLLNSSRSTCPFNDAINSLRYFSEVLKESV